MDLELATVGDIVDELQRRGLAFVLVVSEETNSRRLSLTCVAGQGQDREQIRELIEFGHAVADYDEDDEPWAE